MFLEVSMKAHLSNELILDASLTDPEMCSKTLALVVKFECWLGEVQHVDTCRDSERKVSGCGAHRVHMLQSWATAQRPTMTANFDRSQS